MKKVVRPPSHKQALSALGLCAIMGFIRMSRKIPATTIVLEWSSAETGVGPSIAEGNHG